MEKVLLVDDDSIFLRIIEHEMRKYEGQFEVSLARNGVEAVEALKKEYVSVVVTDLMMPEMDGLELLAHVTRNYPRIPFIVITGCESDELKRWSDPRDKIQLLDKPVDFLNLARWIIEWLDHIDEGNFPPGISVGMALQLIRVQRKTCMLEISHHRKGEGWFYFNKGELNDAHYQDRQGEGAAVDMIGWGRVLLRFESLPNERKVRRIKRDFMELIPDKPDPGEDAPRDGETPGPDKSTETNEMLEEEGAAPEKSAEMELLSRAVLLAEQGRLESAREALARLLKMNPRNRAAWLWDSRIHHDIDAMETSLKKAAAIAPRDPMVVEEIRKFNLFKKKARGEPIRRCPFCWCAVEKMTPVCFYCRSHLYIHDGFFTSTRGGMRDVLEKAILKYERLVGGEVDFNAHYQFGMAWLNLEIWEEGLHQFYEAFRFAPGKNVVSGPLKTLLGFIASMENAPRENVYTRPVRSTMGGPPRREARKNKILVFEANSTTRLVVSLALEREDCLVLEEEDGLASLTRRDETRPDLVLLDEILPGMDGVRAFMNKDVEHKSLPVIMRAAGSDFLDKMKEDMAVPGTPDPGKLVRAVKKYIPQYGEPEESK